MYVAKPIVRRSKLSHNYILILDDHYLIIPLVNSVLGHKKALAVSNNLVSINVFNLVFQLM